MIFRGRYDRARKLQQEKMQGRERAYDDDQLGSKLEKGDTAALIISAMITILPVALIALGVLALVEKFMSHGQADVPDYIPCWTTAFCAFASARPARRYG